MSLERGSIQRVPNMQSPQPRFKPGTFLAPCCPFTERTTSENLKIPNKKINYCLICSSSVSPDVSLRCSGGLWIKKNPSNVHVPPCTGAYHKQPFTMRGESRLNEMTRVCRTRAIMSDPHLATLWWNHVFKSLQLNFQSDSNKKHGESTSCDRHKREPSFLI